MDANKKTNEVTTEKIISPAMALRFLLVIKIYKSLTFGQVRNEFVQMRAVRKVGINDKPFISTINVRRTALLWDP